MLRLSLLTLLLACSGKGADSANTGGVGDGSTDDTSATTGDDTSATDPTECASDAYWTGGNSESPKMNPGEACISCHERSGEGPRFSIAGTVYTNLAEPNDCNGTPSVTVTITDANGDVFTDNTNGAGNFYITDRIATPYTAKVSKDGVEVEMFASQTDGDCNSCHSAEGENGAPGRITL